VSKICNTQPTEVNYYKPQQYNCRENKIINKSEVCLSIMLNGTMKKHTKVCHLEALLWTENMDGAFGMQHCAGVCNHHEPHNLTL
jgi:hypothetical protein